MKERRNPSEAQTVRRMRSKPVGPKDPRARNDAYWALRQQGYSDAFARRAFRDMLPRFYREKMELSGEYIDDIDPDDLLFVPQMNTELKTLAVMVRPELTEDAVATASPRDTEYTIPSAVTPGFGLRVRPSGKRSYVVMFRIAGTKTQGKVTLGDPGVLSLEIAKRLAREVRIEALAGNDPRPMHKSGELLRRLK
ncbi:MAG: Arm DNA-binding domain-containing protein [Hyphomonas sp.]|nr:Arm DNA-binding domain-containing protein [Hyphomonas sp.]